MVVSIREFVFVIVGSVVLSLAILAGVAPWTRHARTLISIGLGIAIGVILWNTFLNVTDARSLNVDSPLLGLSAQDVGSGVGAFVLTLVALRFVAARAEPMSRLLAASGTAGVITLLVDLFG